MTTKAYKIAVIPGDGIGKEVVPEAIRVLEGRGGSSILPAPLTKRTGAAKGSPKRAP